VAGRGVTAGPLVALVDGPLAPDHPALAGVERFDAGGGDGPAAAHAAAMAAAILAHAPGARLLDLVVFGGALSTAAATVARALAAAAASGAPLVHCSFGMARPDPALEAAIAALVGAGRLVTAAAPARGAPVWPAACPGVIAVQGDARCGPADWSRLDLPTAAFGACPAIEGHAPRGASVAAARIAGMVASRLATGLSASGAVAALRAEARFVGRERRRD
jgi:hypothetical protein